MTGKANDSLNMAAIDRKLHLMTRDKSSIRDWLVSTWTLITFGYVGTSLFKLIFFSSLKEL